MFNNIAYNAFTNLNVIIFNGKQNYTKKIFCITKKTVGHKQFMAKHGNKA